MAKKHRPPKRKRPPRTKKYNPKKQGDDDYANASGVMQGITRGLRSVVGTDAGEENDDATEPEHTSRWVILAWVVLFGAAGYFLYQYLT